MRFVPFATLMLMLVPGAARAAAVSPSILMRCDFRETTVTSATDRKTHSEDVTDYRYYRFHRNSFDLLKSGEDTWTTTFDATAVNIASGSVHADGAYYDKIDFGEGATNDAGFRAWSIDIDRVTGRYRYSETAKAVRDDFVPTSRNAAPAPGDLLDTRLGMEVTRAGTCTPAADPAPGKPKMEARLFTGGGSGIVDISEGDGRKADPAPEKKAEVAARSAANGGNGISAPRGGSGIVDISDPAEREVAPRHAPDPNPNLPASRKIETPSNDLVPLSRVLKEYLPGAPLPAGERPASILIDDPALTDAAGRRMPAFLADAIAQTAVQQRELSAYLFAKGPDAAAWASGPVHISVPRAGQVASADSGVALFFKDYSTNQASARDAALLGDFHTHPHPMAFSITDLLNSSRERQASIMINSGNEVWLALPTAATPVLNRAQAGVMRAIVQGSLVPRAVCGQGAVAEANAPEADARMMRAFNASIGRLLHLTVYSGDAHRVHRFVPTDEVDVDVRNWRPRMPELVMMRVAEALLLGQPITAERLGQPTQIEKTGASAGRQVTSGEFSALLYQAEEAKFWKAARAWAFGPNVAAANDPAIGVTWHEEDGSCQGNVYVDLGASAGGRSYRVAADGTVTDITTTN